MDPVFRLIRKHKDQKGSGIMVREAALYLREDLAEGLPDEVRQQAKREMVDGVVFYVFDSPIIPEVAL